MAVKYMNHEEFKKVLLNSEKPVLVDYWAPWCVYCRRIAPVYEKIGVQYEDSLIAAKVNIDESPELAKQEAIEVIPTLVLYKNGKAIDSIAAPESKARIEEFINQHLNLQEVL